MSDAINDLIIRIKNGYMSGREQIEAPYSHYREEVLKKLKSLHYIKDYKVEGDIIKKITLTLSYKGGVPALTEVKIFSTSGRRWYVSVNELKPVLGGMGYSILSTPQGIL